MQTIEEHIAQLKKLRSFHNGSYGASVKVAIDTMRKYQKIEEIVKQYKKFGNIDFSMQIISGVVEDGKIDPQISPCIRNKCHDPATCCGCEDYQRWIDEVNE